MSKTSDKDEGKTSGKDEDRPAARLGSKVANAPVAPNTGGYENRASQGAREHTGMEGKNAGGFETRAAQEQGTH